jgi:hypothetical protein
MNRTASICLLAIALTTPMTATAAADIVAKESLRAAILDLSATFPDRYPQGKEFLARLDRASTAAELDSLRREALLANPLVCSQPILFVVRKQYRPDHHNSATMFQTGEINTGSFEGPGALKLLDLRGAAARQSPRITTLVDVPQGVARDPEVDFDGSKIVFSMRRDREDDYHLYEIRADGAGLRQITFGSGVSDIDPIYLPDGRFLFTSTREPKYCMCNRHIMGNLYTIGADGSHIEQIGHSTLHEGHAGLLPDGRVIYDRWEYVDRNFGNAQGLWTCNPDGTNHVIYYGNSTRSPGAKLGARPIPGSELVVCTFSSCHDRPWGALAILDRRRGAEDRPPVVRTWPAEAIELVGRGSYDTFKAVQPKYQDPFPLSDKYFLCSRMTGRGDRNRSQEARGQVHVFGQGRDAGERPPAEKWTSPRPGNDYGEPMGIYLLDVFGNETLVHVEGDGCFDPMPLAPHVRPPVIPSKIEPAQREGYFYVANVYAGSGMEQIPPGTIKWLRVVESPEKRFWTHASWSGGTGTQAPGMAWDDFNNKRILGTVPVESDGSAYFAVPADRFVYFQVLDEQGMMVQSMRSGTIVRPGERAGCVGCHEGREQSASVTVNYGSLAMRRGPSRLEPWQGPERNFSYTAEVQPVLDRACVACHDYGKEAGKKLNLAGDRNACFNTSYVELRTKRYVRVVGAGPPEVQKPKSWGSHASPLVQVLLSGHGNPEIDRQVKIDREGRDRIVTWIDINAPYYPEYSAGIYREHPFGRCPIDGREMDRLVRLTETSMKHNGPAVRSVMMMNFTRPELSPCLAGIADKNGAAYREALGILETGKERLAKHPRPDMPGFKLEDEIELAQQRKYEELRRPRGGTP